MTTATRKPWPKSKGVGLVVSAAVEYSPDYFTRNSRRAVLPYTAIVESPTNPRVIFDADGIAELAASIATVGLLEPLVVSESHDGGATYELIAGARRIRAIRSIAATHPAVADVPVTIVHGLDDAAVLRLQLVENLQRRDLSPIEEARGFQRLRDEAGMTEKAIAEACGLAQPTVANRLRLLGLAPKVQRAIEAGKLSASHGERLARFSPFPALQEALARRVEAHGITVRTLEKNPLGQEYDLEGKGLIKRLQDVHHFPPCEACPFDARFKGEYASYCLKPAHYAELEAVEQAQRAAEVAAALERIAAGDPAAPVALADLPRASYLILGQYSNAMPAVCEAHACACYRPAVNRQNELVDVCMDPAAYDKAGKAERAAAKAQRVGAVDRYAEAVAAELDRRLHAAEPLEVSPIYAALVARTLPESYDAAYKGLLPLVAESFPELAGDGKRTHLPTLEELARFEPARILEFGMRALLLYDLARLRDEGLDGWYAQKHAQSLKLFVPIATVEVDGLGRSVLPSAADLATLDAGEA